MTAWHGDPHPNKSIEPIKWYKTSLWQKLWFLILRKPVYRFQTRGFDQSIYNVRDLTKLIAEVNPTGEMLAIQVLSDKGYADYTRFLAKDQTAINVITLTK